MSLILNDPKWMNPAPRREHTTDGQRELSRLDRYLAILHENKSSCSFVPSDAFVALDMAGFVRGQIDGTPFKPRISAARLALSLAQPCYSPPVQ